MKAGISESKSGRKTKSTLALLLSLFVVAATAQQGSPVKRCPVKTLNFETGLMNNGATAVITDKLGFTWVSTKTGLQRFNGYSLQTITPVSGNDVLTIDGPSYFFALQDGCIWISFKQIVLEYNPSSNSFRTIISLHETATSPYLIVPLKETSGGIWCMQEKKGIVIYNRDGKLTEQLSLIEPSVADEIINSRELLYQNRIAVNGKHIFINRSAGNSNYNLMGKTGGSVFCIDADKREIRDMAVPDSTILGIASINNHLCVLSTGSLFFVSLDNFQVTQHLDLKKFNPDNITLGNLQFNGNNLLLGLNNHLYELDTSGNYRAELTDLNRNPVVAAGFIHQICPDVFKRIWVITNNDIKRLENLEIPFAHFIYPNEKNNFTRCLYFDKEKNIVITGCFYSGIQLYDTLANPLTEKTISYPGVRNIINIEKLTSNDYLLITYDNGWFIFNYAAKSIKPFRFPPGMESYIQPLQVNFSNNLQRISNDTLIICSANNVFKCRFDGTVISSAQKLLPDLPRFKNTIGSVLYDSQKNLWAVNNSALIRTDKNGNRKSLDIPGQYNVRCLAEDSEHNIWAGTEKGLYIFSNEGALLQSFTIQSGLRNDCIYSLLPVNGSTSMFAASNLGISLVSLNGSIKNFSKEMGLQENEFNTEAALKSPSGKFYFGGINGITAFYPSSLSIINDTPFLYVTRLVVNDSLYNSSAGVWLGDTINLRYYQNRLRFDIAAIGLLNTNEYVYQYRMKRFEEGWQTTYLPTGINYTLEPGTYELEIICHPVLSTEITFKKTFIIRISPPWWQTWWFRSLAALFVIGIIFLSVQQYNRRKYLKRIRELQAQYKVQQERERISRDLHDNIGVQASAILYNSEKLQQAGVTKNELVDDLHDTAKEMLLNLRETLWAMKTADVPAQDLWMRIISFCKQMGRHYSSIKFNIDGHAPDAIMIPSAKALNIVMIIQEAVNNAAKYAEAKQIVIKSIFIQDAWQINITDDGKGFEIDEADRKKDSHGLDNMKQRANASELSLAIDSERGKGTNVSITFRSK